MLALDKDKNVFSFGCNLYGQLGRNENKNDKESQTPILIASLKNKQIVQVEAGFRHSLALDATGKVYSAGHNEYGELGDGTQKDGLAGFKQIQGIPKIKKIVASYDYSLLLNEEGQLWGFGQNQYQQLNENKEIKQVLTPIKVGDKKFIDVFSKGIFILGIVEV
jgi:alpha-tubulin suppressor-like RCC1 family protein